MIEFRGKSQESLDLSEKNIETPQNTLAYNICERGSLMIRSGFQFERGKASHVCHESRITSISAAAAARTCTLALLFMVVQKLLCDPFLTNSEDDNCRGEE